MTLLKNKMLIIVIALAVAAVAAGVFMTQHTDFVTDKFAGAGYILGEPSEDEEGGYVSTQMHFAANEVYKTDSDANLVFKAQEADETRKEIVPDYGFIHYDDGGLSSFKTGVVMDPETLSGSELVCYNVDKGSVIERAGDAFSIEHLGDKLSFESITWKLDEGRYLFAGDSVALSLGEEPGIDLGDYAEVTYIDDGVLRIASDENATMTVSPVCELTINGTIKVDLGARVISNGATAFSLADMVVDSPDNVDLMETNGAQVGVSLPKFTVVNGADGARGADGAEGPAGVKGAAGAAGAAGDSGGAGDPGSGGKGGGEGGEGPEGSEGSSGSSGPSGAGQDTDADDGDNGPVEEVELPSLPNFALPSFNVNAFDVNVQSGLQAIVKISDTDKADTPVKNVVAQIVRTDTGEVVWSHSYGDAEVNVDTELSISLPSDRIAPGREYRLTLTGEYDIEGTTYSKVFVKKLFVGGEIGVSMQKKSVTSNSVTVDLYKETYSEVDLVTVSIYRKVDYPNGPVAGIKQDVQLTAGNTAGVTPVTFEGLNVNTEYIVTLSNLIKADGGSNIQIAADYGVPLEVKTLIGIENLSPGAIGAPNVAANRYNRTISVWPGLMDVPDINSVKKYTYQFFPDTQVTSDGALIGNHEPVLEIVTDKRLIQYANVSQSSGYNPATGEQFLSWNMRYRVRLMVEFNDNEKNYLLYSKFSGPVGLSGTIYPTVEFHPNLDPSGSAISFYDKVIGSLVIESNGATFSPHTGYSDPTVILKFENLDYTQEPITETYILPAPTGPTDNKRYELAVACDGLKADTRYAVSVWANVNFMDGSGSNNVNIADLSIGKETVSTVTAHGFEVGLEAVEQGEYPGATGAINALMYLTDVGTETSDYEAARLGEIMLELHAGNSPASPLIASAKLVSSNLNPGMSTLRGELYNPVSGGAVLPDNYVIVNESTFGIDANAIKNYPVLTLVVTGANDYTSSLYDTQKQNYLINYFDLAGTTTVQLRRNEVAPILPPLEDAIDMTLITEANKQMYTPIPAGLRAGYEGGTVIGFKLTARFGAPSVASSVTYDLYRSNEYVAGPPVYIQSSELLDTGRTSRASIELPVQDGVLPTLIVLFGKESDYNITDATGDEIHYLYIENSEQEARGYNYYATYTAKLTLTNPKNPTSDYIYPRDYDGDGGDHTNDILRSKRLAAPYQAPRFVTYPSTTDNVSEIWKYRLTDIDSAYVPNSAAEAGGGGVAPVISKTDPSIAWGVASFNTLNVTGLTPNKTFAVNYKWQQWAYADPAAQVDAPLMSWFHEGSYGPPGGNNVKYTVTPNETRNKVFFVFPDMTQGVYDHVAAAKVTATHGADPSKTATYYLPVEIAYPYSATPSAVAYAASVDYARLSGTFTGTPQINFVLELLYDSGTRGFEIGAADGYAVQTYDGTSAGKYYKRTAAGQIITAVGATGVYYTNPVYTAPASANAKGKLEYRVAMENDRQTTVNLLHDNQGAKDENGGGYLALKALGSVPAQVDGASSIQMPKLVPTVDSYDVKERGFTDAKIEFKVSGANVLKDYSTSGAKILMAFYKLTTDINGATISTLIENYEIPCTGDSDTYAFEFGMGGKAPLEANTDYCFYLSGVMDGESSARSFFDAATDQTGRQYRFKTANTLTIGGASGDISIFYNASNYDTKYMELRYLLSGASRGFTIEYEVQKTSGLGAGEVQIFPESNNVFYTDGKTQNIGRIAISSADSVSGSALEGFWEYGATYEVTVKAHSDSTSLGAATVSYKLPVPRQPQFIVTATPDTSVAPGVNNTYPVVFKVSPVDTDCTVVNSHYAVRILNAAGVDVTPVDIAKTIYEFGKTSNRIQTISAYDLAPAQGYTMQIYAVDDRLYEGGAGFPPIDGIAIPTPPDGAASAADPTLASRFVKGLQFDVSLANAVQIGDVTVSTLAGGSTRLVFENSINLDQAEFIQYSISLTDSGELPVSSQPLEFALKTQGAGGGAYKYFDLPTTISNPGLYLMELRFTNTGGLLVEKTISFRKLT